MMREPSYKRALKALRRAERDAARHARECARLGLCWRNVAEAELAIIRRAARELRTMEYALDLAERTRRAGAGAA